MATSVVVFSCMSSIATELDELLPTQQTMNCEQTLMAKLQSLKEVVERVRKEEEEVPTLYSFEQFCRDLDVNDVYVQRLLELLVRETARSSSLSIGKKGLLTQLIVEE